MKTRKINSLKVVICITFLPILFIIASCNGRKDSLQEDSASPVSQTEVKAPQIDIHTAVITGNLEALQQHIAAGTDLNEKDPFGGSSPLISASVFGKPEIAKVLIEAGADLDFQNNDGSTSLHTAAFFCRPEIVRMLLDKGADKTISNKFGATAYASVAGPFSEVKNSYDMMGTILGPAGLKLDYPYIEKTRPEIAAMLK
jgi:ankyrin repeat protein